MRKSEEGSSPVPKRHRVNGRINRRLAPFSSRVLRSLSPVGGLARRQPRPPVQTVGKAALAEWWYEGSDQNHVRNFGKPVYRAVRYKSDQHRQWCRSVSPPRAGHPSLRPRHPTPEPLGRHPSPNNDGLVQNVDGGDSDEYDDDYGYYGSEEEFEEDVPVDEEDLDSEPEVESDDDDGDANWEQGKSDDENHIIDPNDVVVKSDSEGTEDETTDQLDESTDEEEDWPDDDSDYHP